MRVAPADGNAADRSRGDRPKREQQPEQAASSAVVHGPGGRAWAMPQASSRRLDCVAPRRTPAPPSPRKRRAKSSTTPPLGSRSARDGRGSKETLGTRSRVLAKVSVAIARRPLPDIGGDGGACEIPTASWRPRARGPGGGRSKRHAPRSRGRAPRARRKRSSGSVKRPASASLETTVTADRALLELLEERVGDGLGPRVGRSEQLAKAPRLRPAEQGGWRRTPARASQSRHGLAMRPARGAPRAGDGAPQPATAAGSSSPSWAFRRG